MKIKEVKIRTKKGKIITLKISEQTETHLVGTDKYGIPTVVAIKDIDSMGGTFG